MMDISEFLLSNPLFDTFDRTEAQALARAMTTVTYPDGHVFLHEGKKGDACYLILEGDVSVTRMATEGRGIEHVRTMGPGELFGLIALVDHGKRAATCTAIAHHFQYVIARQLARDLRAYNHALLAVLLGQQSESRISLRAI
ncbi:MAG: cyclic nucleotide-binding domain-containing protein [Acidiferrobacteraceae bacterium]